MDPIANRTSFEMYINGEWVSGSSRFNVTNPATGEEFATVAYGDESHAVKAMDAAAAAFTTYRKTTVYERADKLHAAANLVRQRSKEIAKYLTLENGKPFAESLGETMVTANWLDWYAEEAKRAYGRIIPSNFPNKQHWVTIQPVGVCVAITPWNFPIHILARKFGAGLAAGCTVVGMPSLQAPISPLMLVEALHDAGFPKGTVNLVFGDPPKICKAMMGHLSCRKLSFTGSTAVGKKIIADSAENVVKLSLELGGNAPMLVMGDVEVSEAAAKACSGKYRNMGQSCIAPQRFFIKNTIFDEFSEHVVKCTEKLVIGNGLREGVDLGPAISLRHLEKIEGLVDEAVAKGAKVLTGGKRMRGGEYDKGFFYQPTVLSNVTRDMKIYREEVFGPVMLLMPFSTEEEAISLANDTEYGLGAYVLVKDLSTAIRVTNELNFGIIGLNDVTPTVSQAPFGGMKHSGYGKEGGYEGLEPFIERKYISVVL